jgi:hypothetical protein
LNNYGTVHWRLAINRGRASEFACVDGCGRPAAQWSYIGGDPNEKVRPEGYRFSLDLGYYVPRCAPCHNTHDGHFGQSHGSAKMISDVQVAELRTAYSAGETAASLGRRFGISQNYAWAIANGRYRTR